MPQFVVLDVDLVRSAPKRLNRSGIGDILSCHTGLWDWRYAVERGRGVPWDDAAAALGRQLLVELEEHVDEINAVTPARGALARIRISAHRRRVQRTASFAIRRRLGAFSRLCVRAPYRRASAARRADRDVCGGDEYAAGQRARLGARHRRAQRRAREPGRSRASAATISSARCCHCANTSNVNGSTTRSSTRA